MNTEGTITARSQQGSGCYLFKMSDDRLVTAKRKSQPFDCGSLCWRYLSFWVGQVLRLERSGGSALGLVASQQSGGLSQAQKSPDLSVEAVMLALPIFPGSRPPSIVGANELNFCVRDGNRWTLIAINTNSYGWGVPHRLYPSPVGLCCRLWNHLNDPPPI